MKNRDKLILLADKLDRQGMSSEASLVDKVIIKRSFDEDTRKDINSVLQMTLELLEELDGAVENGVAGLETEPGSGSFIKGWSGAIEDESLKNYYKDKINKLKEATEHVQELTALTSEDSSSEEGAEGGAAMPNPGPPADEGESEESTQEEKPWWKFWEKSEDTMSEEGEEGDSGGKGYIVGPDGKKYYTGALPPEEEPLQEEAIPEEPEGEGGGATEELPAGTGVIDRGDPTDWWNRPENRGWTSRMYGGENNPDLRGKG